MIFSSYIFAEIVMMFLVFYTGKGIIMMGVQKQIFCNIFNKIYVSTTFGTF